MQVAVGDIISIGENIHVAIKEIRSRNTMRIMVTAPKSSRISRLKTREPNETNS